MSTENRLHWSAHKILYILRLVSMSSRRHFFLTSERALTYEIIEAIFALPFPASPVKLIKTPGLARQVLLNYVADKDVDFSQRIRKGMPDARSEVKQ